MLYKMNTKTFIKIFANENPKTIEKTQFLIVSKRIRKTEEDDNVIFVPDWFPSDMLLADYRSEFQKGYFEEEYKKELDRYKLLIAIIVKGIVEEDATAVMLCTLKEWHVGYMKILSDYIQENFGYPVIDYKKYKTKKKLPKAIKHLNTRAIIDRCNEVIAEESEKRKNKLLKTREGRLKLLNDMSKEEMIKTLKKMNLYSDGLDKTMMKEILMEFFVED